MQTKAPEPGEVLRVRADDPSVVLSDTRRQDLHDLIDAGRQRVLLAILEWPDGCRVLMRALSAVLARELDPATLSGPGILRTTDAVAGIKEVGYREIGSAINALRTFLITEDPRQIPAAIFDCIGALEILNPGLTFPEIVVSLADPVGADAARAEVREGLALIRHMCTEAVRAAITGAPDGLDIDHPRFVGEATNDAPERGTRNSSLAATPVN